jgi:hypothetical protein
MTDQISVPEPQQAAAPTNTMALVSLVAGIAGLTILPFFGSIVAVITGPMARKEIAASAGAQSGDGMARAGMILGWIGLGLSLIGVCVACVVFLLVPLGIFGAIQRDTSLLLLAGMI